MILLLYGGSRHPDQPLNKAFEEKTNLHADNALANDVDNMPAIVSCVGRIHPSLLKFMYEQLTFHAKKGTGDSFVESNVRRRIIYWKKRLFFLNMPDFDCDYFQARFTIHYSGMCTRMNYRYNYSMSRKNLILV